MIVVADTSPINYLVLLGSGSVLETLFGQVVVPAAVVQELLHPKAPEIVKDWAINLPAWIHVREPKTNVTVEELGPGETDAIELARELAADLLLIDDRDAAQYAVRQGLQIAGTLNILDMAAAKNLLSLPETIVALRGTTFRASTDVYEIFLRRDVERRQQGN